MMYEMPKRKILLNPGPVTTTDSVKKSLMVSDICHREKEFCSVIQNIRENLKKVVHAGESYTTVLFSGSGTAGVEATISSVIPHNKKIAVINNGSYGERIVEIGKTYNIETINITSPFNEPISLEKISSIIENDPDIYAVAMVHHETSTGLLNPLSEVSHLVKKLNRILIVDAISSFAGVPIDLEKNPITYLVGSPNKCLQGLPGAAFVICDKMQLALHQKNRRSFYLDLYAQNEFLEKEGMLRFTPPVQIFYALQQALIEYFQEGEMQRYERYKRNFQILVNGLEQLGFNFLIPKECWSNLLILVSYPLSKKKIEFNRLHDELYEKGFTIYPSKFNMDNAFRLACMGHLTSNDIEFFLSLLKKTLFE